eukprot:6476303-Amphidinium_carterae.1
MLNVFELAQESLIYAETKLNKAAHTVYAAASFLLGVDCVCREDVLHHLQIFSSFLSTLVEWLLTLEAALS